jgi:crossover junction endodeoxyribonuclease RuvC
VTIILGIDPGSVKTGFGIINTVNGRHEYVGSGVIRLPVKESLPYRLQLIFENIGEIIKEYAPQEMAIESVFLSKSAGSALKLGQARGAAIVAATSHGLSVSEYEAKKVKQSVVGNGGADKHQVQQMIKQLLKLSATPQEDAADALANALCHANTQHHLINVAQAKQYRRGRMV